MTSGASGSLVDNVVSDPERTLVEPLAADVLPAHAPSSSQVVPCP
ncbi:hypothetical protein HMPREF0063_12958 [Aeromicrobium marinum DSM 15272]|uniref:Uncharacterized protein n=1 Tax=Aeromicrobium marinum DSM 15272 TaxID=585531 RepID=E2SFZ9_9ACTN|nr:hypothetical protein HMPREF0063_12958 [Aeromicrobium marinum DSM 15272]